MPIFWGHLVMSDENALAVVVDPVVEIPEARNPKVDIGKALKLYLFQGVSQTDIAKMMRCSQQAIQKAIAPFVILLKNPEALQTFRDRKIDLLDSVTMELMENLVVSDKLKKASLNNVAYALTQVHHITQLEKGQPTENIDVDVRYKKVTSLIEKLQDELECSSNDNQVIDVTPTYNVK